MRPQKEVNTVCTLCVCLYSMFISRIFGFAVEILQEQLQKELENFATATQ